VKNIDLSKITTYQAGAVQASMHRTLQQKCDEILLPFGISKMHWLIVGHVWDAGPEGIRISDLAASLGTTISYLTTATNSLEAKGYLMRKENDEDGRSKFIVINPKKVKKCREIERTLRAGLRSSIYAKINPEEFRTYLKVMYDLSSIR
jgi:DNA-binding MarR family transcriptional regulator